MPLSSEDVRAMADYARIALADDELDAMRDYLNDAIALLQPIRSYDLDGVEPTVRPIGNLANVMAEDEVDAHGRSLDLAMALGNAASTQGRSFRVPQIVGEGDGAQ